MDDTFERQVQPLANQLRGLFPSLTIEQATDSILRHGLNLQASIDELLANPIPALPPKNSNPFVASSAPLSSPTSQPNTSSNLLDLDDLFSFSSPKTTPQTAQNYSTTSNDLSDIFGGIATSPPPETPPPKKEHKKKHVTKAESETEKEPKKKEKKSKEGKDKSDVKKDSEKKSKKDTSYSDTEAVEIKNKDKEKKKEKEKVKEEKDKHKAKEDKEKDKHKAKDDKEKDKHKAKEDKEKKEKDKQKAKEEKEKKEKEDKKKHDKEQKDKHKSDKRKSVDPTTISNSSDTIKHDPSPILSSYDKSGESEEELSKPEEGVMQWITKLKKAHTSRLITITNQSKFILERKKLHQTKGKWRRKPPDSIYLNNSAQFGVEGKNGTEGGCSFSLLEDYADNLEFVWTYNNEKDKVPTTYCVVPASLTDHVVIVVLSKLSDKFCDIQFVIKNKNDEKATESQNHSVNGHASENESDTVSVASSKSMLQSLQKSGSNGSLSSTTYKVTEYHQGQTQNDDSSSDSEDEASKEENRRKSLIRNMKLKQSEESVEHVDSKTLAAAVSSLKLAGPISGNLSDGGSARAARRRTRPATVVGSSPDVTGGAFTPPPNLNLFAKETDNSISIPNPNLTESEREDDDLSVKNRNTQAHNDEEEDVEVDINEKSKNLIKSAFSKLESGHFSESLNDVNETLRLFVSLSDPRAKQRESKICTIYKFGLNILINRPRESDSQRVALLLKTLADLTWQPKHRIVCIRMAIKANMESKNYGVAARFIQQLLPLELADKKNQESNLQLCKDNNLTDQIQTVFPYTCPHCTKPASVGNPKCNSCNSPILMCYNVKPTRICLTFGRASKLFKRHSIFSVNIAKLYLQRKPSSAVSVTLDL